MECCPVTYGHRRLLRHTALAVAGVLVLTAIVAAGAYRYYNGRITRITVSALGHAGTSAGATSSPAPAVVTGSYFLLAGSDTRSISDGSNFGGGAVSGQRSDTVILVHIPPGNAKATLMSFPRDSYVTIPAYTDSSGSTVAAHKAKLNEAYALGGANLLVATIEQLTGLPIDHYLQVNFDGFRNIVNAVGGVTLCVTTSRNDSDSGDHLSAGTHPNVGGNAALAFVRDRKGLPAGDLSRIQDQQYFLSQLMKKVLSAGTLTSPVRLAALLSAVTGSLTVDKGFGLAQFRALASHVSSLTPSRVTFVPLPITTAAGWRDIHGVRQSVVLLDDTHLPAAFATLAGTAPATPTTAASPTPGSSSPTTGGGSTAAPTTTAATASCAP
jgi:LCP family protein required for cell wall assembly